MLTPIQMARLMLAAFPYNVGEQAAAAARARAARGRGLLPRPAMDGGNRGARAPSGDAPRAAEPRALHRCPAAPPQT